MKRNTHQLVVMSMIGGLALSTSAWGHGDKFKMMDSNGDGMISASEHAAGVKSMFDKMDANHDGSVTAAEMDAGHQRMKGAKTMPGKSMGDMKHEMSSAEKIKLMDTDGDGMLSASEHDAGAQKMFTDMDSNHAVIAAANAR